MQGVADRWGGWGWEFYHRPLDGTGGRFLVLPPNGPTSTGRDVHLE